MSQDYKFQGWIADDESSVKGNLRYGEYEPKRWEEGDVDIEITHCGICGSDLHTLRSGWENPKPRAMYPIVVGHEIVGKAVKVGKNVKHVKVGDRVGVGAQSESCMECEMCKNDNSPYCTKTVDTYNATFSCGDKSMGGYGDYSRVPGNKVINLEEFDIPSHIIAPMLCGGVTLFSPLQRFGCGKEAQTVGIIGVGGLGHFGIMLAKAMGAKTVVGFSRKKDKEKDVLALGADLYVATEENDDWKKEWASKFDLIVSTVSSDKLPLEDLLSLVKTFGHFVQVGAPDDNLPPFHAFSLLRGVQLTGSSIGSPKDITDMLKLIEKKGVRTWAVPMPLDDVNKGLKEYSENGPPRFRYVLVNEKHAKMPVLDEKDKH